MMKAGTRVYMTGLKWRNLDGSGPAIEYDLTGTIVQRCEFVQCCDFEQGADGQLVRVPRPNRIGGYYLVRLDAGERVVMVHASELTYSRNGQRQLQEARA